MKELSQDDFGRIYEKLAEENARDQLPPVQGKESLPRQWERLVIPKVELEFTALDKFEVDIQPAKNQELPHLPLPTMTDDYRDTVKVTLRNHSNDFVLKKLNEEVQSYPQSEFLDKKTVLPFARKDAGRCTSF